MTNMLSIEALLVVIVLIIYILTSHIIKLKKVKINKKITFIHESSVAIILGLASALITKTVPFKF